MRYYCVSTIAALAMLAASPNPSHAQIGGVFNALTAPLRPIVGGLRAAIGHRHYRHSPRRSATRAAPLAAAAPTAAQAANAKKSAVVVWPSAADDLFGYTFQPTEHASAFFARGYGDVAQVMSPPQRGGADNDDCQAVSEHTDWTEQLSQSLQLADEQQTAMAPLRTALTEAVRRIDASCSQSAATTPRDRLRAAASRLWSIWDASLLVRSPLEMFYNSLTDDQKTKLNGEPVMLDACAATDKAAADPRGAGRSRRASRHKRTQSDMMGMLSTDMTKFLAKSCPAQSSATPVGRLDAATNRVNALLYVTRSMDQALSAYAEAGAQQDPRARKR